MQIEQYIYTRLTADQSPHKTTGFQSAFMPAGLVGKLHAVSLESHIHLPDSTIVQDKRTVFWVEIDRIHWQVILFISSLPEARDEFGRAGISLVHGFLFPPEIWRQFRNPLRLAHAMDEHRLHTIEDVLQSPMVDRKTGTISPFSPGVLPADDASGCLPPSNDTERALLALCYRIAKGSANNSALVYKGTSKAAELLFGRIASYLPRELRQRLAWDSGFDAGKLFFSPSNLVAYSVVPPVTGYQATFHPGQERIEYTDAAQEALIRPHDVFSRWLAFCLDHSMASDEVDAVYALSRIIQEKLPFTGAAASPGFARANEEAIRTWLAEGTDPLIPREWRGPVAKYLTGKEVQELATGGFSDPLLAGAVAKAILRGQLTPSNFPTHPPTALLNSKEPRLAVLGTMWSHTPIDKHALLDIVIEEREQILVLLAKAGTTREGARALGFTEDEIKFADAHFHSRFGRMVRSFFGR